VASCSNSPASSPPSGETPTNSSGDSATTDTAAAECRARTATSGDIIVRIVTPNVAPAAMVLGGGWVFNEATSTCQTSVDWQISTAPTGAGFCTQVALAAENPGYDVNADPPAELKHVIRQAGEGC